MGIMDLYRFLRELLSDELCAASSTALFVYTVEGVLLMYESNDFARNALDGSNGITSFCT
jgi:hypothetical protein